MKRPNKELIETVAVGALLVVLALSYLHSKSRAGRGSAGRVEKGERSIFDLVGANKRIASLSVKPMDSIESQTVRDALVRPEAVRSLEMRTGKTVPSTAGDRSFSQDKDKLVLQGTVINGKENLAIISGNVVAVGDVVGGARVMKITGDGAILSKDGLTIELKR